MWPRWPGFPPAMLPSAFLDLPPPQVPADMAQEPARGDAELTRLEAVVVEGREESLVGLADSATEGRVGQEELATRPLLRPADVLETVPGVIVTQHSGSGKANQYFVRGFNLDHGTDFQVSVDGVPINLPTHGHGQGYTDLNFLIPELIESVDYQKGPYDAAHGDFASAGAVEIRTFRVLAEGVAKLEAGSFGFARALVADSQEMQGGSLLHALELARADGPWEHPDDFEKLNGLVRFSRSKPATTAGNASPAARRWTSAKAS